MRSLRVLWFALFLLSLTSITFGQSLRNVRPHSDPAGPGKVSSNPGKAVAGTPRMTKGKRGGGRDSLKRPGGPLQPGGGARDPKSAPRPPANPPQIGPPPVNLVHLQKHTVKVTVTDGIASTTIEQVYRNEADRQMEASWFCPIPPRTVLHGFSIWMGGREVHASVMDRTTARRIYDRIVGRKRDPGLVELVNGERIRTSIFPIPPKGEFRIRTRYSSVVTGDTIAMPFPKTPKNSRPIADVKADLVFRSTLPVALRRTTDAKVRLAKYDGGRYWSGKFRAKKHRGDGPMTVQCRFRPTAPGLTLNVHPGKNGERTFAAILTAGGRTLSKSKLSFEGLKVASMHPEEIPDIPPGGSFVVFGRLEGDGKPVCKLRARTGLLPVRVTAPVTKTGTTAAETRHIPCFWAQGEFLVLKKNPKNYQQALDLAIKYGILTEYTALLAK